MKCFLPECNDGTYGYDCVKICSPNCINNNCTKHLDELKCSEGCVPGYSGDDCQAG